jgi:glycosyltransferase involved in cell wall biosynthesis
MKPRILFIQNSPYLAGAEKSLSRLLKSPLLRADFSLRLMTGKPGWLTRACEAAAVDLTIMPFPSSRSLTGRMWGNRRFVSAAARLIRQETAPSQALVIHANDHPDSLLGLSLARATGSPSVLTLRTPGMSKRDFFKYRCNEHDAMICVGDDLFNKVAQWNQGTPQILVHNGIGTDEVISPRQPVAEAVERVLVLGSLSPRKGWHDLIDSLVLLEQAGLRNLPEFVFIGHHHGLDPVTELGLSRLSHCKTSFVGVIEEFRDYVQAFPLAVHPSRSESFGMAAIETVAAGVPLLAAATGVIPSFIPSPQFLCEPGNVADLSSKLEFLLDASPARLQRIFDMQAGQDVIRRSFMIDRTAAQLKEIYGRVLKP